MAITYTYQIEKILTAPAIDNLTDVVTEVYYSYTGSEGTGENKVTAAINGVAVLGDPDPDNFTAFNELTEADVREFVKAVANIESNKQLVQEQITAQKTPRNVEKPLPWA
tara:strand:- start:91 stop:420 length:330 start_codon:yes stop_codon:yes gene_type:complete